MCIRDRASSRGIQLNSQLSSDIPKIWVSDPARLRQILINLLSNSLKFTRQGSVSLQITHPTTNSLRFAVKDTGVGIREEDKGKLFRAFGKLGEKVAARMNTQGVGLGLMISQSLAQRLGPVEKSGIEVECDMSEELLSDDDMGEDPIPVGLRMSQHRTPEPRASLQNLDMRQSREMSASTSLKSTLQEKITRLKAVREEFGCSCPLVLIVDDNDFNIYSLRKILNFHGIEAQGVLDGDEAIKAVKNQCQGLMCRGFELILMDCEMPGRDGFETAKELCKMMNEGLCRKCPILATTGHAAGDVQERCLEAGMSDFITKPIYQDDIRSCLLYTSPSPRDS
eukprot:TRINITY_DN7158_c0_g1_i2.p1 TRINITY_DN7158_c0_g1~~TRINITY_DN7158_c0_g1_i2.p1  ORF type:complete len:339 (-),score=74.02 TRINITY_DN7158_c0_g1_i2:38-1054(-)